MLNVSLSYLFIIFIVSMLTNTAWAADIANKSHLPGSISIKLNIGKINNILSNTTNSQARVNIGHIKQSIVNGSADIRVDVTKVDNKVSGGANNHSTINIGVIKNSRVGGAVNINVSKAREIKNSIVGGSGNRSEISIACIGCDDDDEDNRLTGVNNNTVNSVPNYTIKGFNSVVSNSKNSTQKPASGNKKQKKSEIDKAAEEKLRNRWRHNYSHNYTFSNRMQLLSNQGRYKEMLDYIRLIESALSILEQSKTKAEYRRLSGVLFYNRNSDHLLHPSMKRNYPGVIKMLGASAIMGGVIGVGAGAYLYGGVVLLARALYEVAGAAELAKDYLENKKLKKKVDVAFKNLKRISPKTFDIQNMFDSNAGQFEKFFGSNKLQLPPNPSTVSKKVFEKKVKKYKLDLLRSEIFKEFERVGAMDHLLVRKAIQAQMVLLSNSKNFIRFLSTKKRNLRKTKTELKLYVLSEIGKLSVMSTFLALKSNKVIKDMAIFKKPFNNGVNLYVRLNSGEWVPVQVGTSRDKSFRKMDARNADSLSRKPSDGADRYAIASLKYILEKGDSASKKLAQKIWNQQAVFRNKNNSGVKIPSFNKLSGSSINNGVFGRGMFFQISNAKSKQPKVSILNWDDATSNAISVYNKEITADGHQ